MKCKYERCSFDAPSNYRGWCNAHYLQQLRGQELRPRRDEPWTVERILEECVQDGDCLLFRPETKAKYTLMRFNRTAVGAHRVVYELTHGVDVEGMQIHHKCANAKCVNPDHLERATQAENMLEMLARRDYEAEIARLQLRIVELEAQLEWELA